MNVILGNDHTSNNDCILKVDSFSIILTLDNNRTHYCGQSITTQLLLMINRSILQTNIVSAEEYIM